MKKRLLSLMAVSAILLVMASFAIVIVSAFPNDVVREKTFITYYVDPLGTPYTDTYNVYAYSGVHWSTGRVVTYSVNTKGAPAGAIIAVNRYDGKNVISWGRLGRGIIAQTTVWYYTTTLEIVEFGMVFNTAYKWGIDADGEGSAYTLTNAFDVQNIATHEAGHTSMLDDLYMPETSALTMYGYGSYGQTYAISLGAGDVNGIM